MKKTIILCALLFVCTLKAQQIKFGTKAGVNSASFTTKEFKRHNVNFGFYGGTYANIKLTNKFYIQPEILVSSQGYKSEVKKSNPLSSTKKDQTLSLIYLNVPVTIQYEIVKGLKAEAGPQFGYLISSEMKNTTTTTTNGISNPTIITEKENGNKYIKNLDLGLNLGINYELKNGLNFGVRYNLGLTNIDKKINTSSEISSGLNLRKSVISVGVGYTFK